MGHAGESGAVKPHPSDCARCAAAIPNHLSAKLSALDMQVVHSVPPGGNWKHVPETVPSARLEQIRRSYAAGEGSRSTYYGRLRPDKPSYTINTYFARPGNGCHIHYSQDRVLSQREAARLQSFPDRFAFHGSNASVNKQIGNAVPPLLGHQVARTLGKPGEFVDLFAGAGGLGLGFKWAGWQPLLGNDIEPSFLETYQANVHPHVVLGDIQNAEVFDDIINRVTTARTSSLPLWVLGGPPCQGFSTAGKQRSMGDERNHLFLSYKRVLEALQPDGFVFENVSGLLNMDGGQVFRDVRAALASAVDDVTAWVVKSEEYGVPQRRTRVIIVGVRRPTPLPPQPPQITYLQTGLFAGKVPAVTVVEALSDLPPLQMGEDGSNLHYMTAPQTKYQAFMRGEIGANELVDHYRLL